MRQTQVATNITIWQIAERMTRNNMRPPLVRTATRLSLSALRDLWHSIHGERPPKGMLPDHSLSLLRRHRQVIHGSLFFSAYYALGGEGIFLSADNEVLLSAYDTYQTTVESMDARPVIDMTTAWYIARDLRTGMLEKAYCRTCRTHYLYSPQSPLLHDCPFCDLHHRPERLKGTFMGDDTDFDDED